MTRRAWPVLVLALAACDSALPAPEPTFHACADGDTAYIGGFHLTRPACVPLVISETGRPPTQVTVSFFAGACPS